MKPTLLFLLAWAIPALLSAQIKAVTETGEEVLLFDDGSWEYVAGAALEKSAEELPTNPETFQKPPNATFLLKSTVLNIGIWLDPKKFSFKKAAFNPDAEYEVHLKDDDLYAMVITEKIEVPLSALRRIALDNGRMAAPDLRVVKEEYRMVNGLKVLHMQMNGSIEGIKLTYYGYYFSNPKGTVQLVAYTSQNLLSEYLAACEELLNGLVELE